MYKGRLKVAKRAVFCYCDIMNIEAIIKGRIAEHLVEFLLQESGYRVVRIAQEGLLLGVARGDIVKLKNPKSNERVLLAPSFAIFDKKGTMFKLIKVRYRGIRSRGGNVASGFIQLQRYWPEALLVVVTQQGPYFGVMVGKEEQVSIEKIFTLIKKETLSLFKERARSLL